jgi:hypothetical protein
MKRWAWLLLFVCFSTNVKQLNAQEYWSRSYDLDQQYGNKFVPVSDGMIILIDKSCSFTNCISLMKVDYSGNLLWVIPIDSVTTGHTEGIELENSTILVNVKYTFIGPVMPWKAYSVFAFNPDGEYLWNHDYYFTFGGSPGLQSEDWPFEIISAGDHRYVSSALDGPINFKVRIRAYDTNWNQLWQKTLNGGQYLRILDMEPTIDSGLVVTLSFRAEDNLYHNSIERYDKNGSLLWTTTFEENYGFTYDHVDITSHPDGSFFGVRKVDQESFDPNINDNPDIIYKLDSAGQFVWQKLNTSYQDFQHLFVTNNGDIVGCGISYPSENTLGKVKAYFRRMNIDGETIWERNIADSTDVYLTTSLRYGNELANGDLVFSGVSSNTQQAFVWLLKTDSNGCLYPGCSNEVQTYISTSEATPKTIDAFGIFTNPFRNRLVLGTVLGRRLPEGNYYAAVYDLQGQVIYSPRLIQPDMLTDFEMNAQLPGMYIVHIFLDGVLVQILKSVKE